MPAFYVSVVRVEAVPGRIAMQDGEIAILRIPNMPDLCINENEARMIEPDRLFRRRC